MKKLIVLLTVFTIAGLSAFATGGESTDVKNYYSQYFAYKLSFNKIVVADDIDLVIYENSTTNIQFDGTKENIEKVDWKVKNGTLYIKSKSGSLKSKVIVTLDVTNLDEISIEGQSSVRSLGNLNSPKLDVYMKSGSFVAIRNYGTINIISEDAEISVLERSGDISII